jgi:SHS2 domain-containing protein
MGDFEIIEHTADVGIRATGATIEEVFEQATRGLAHIMGIWHPGTGERVPIEVEARDREALLVDWLSEVLWLHDSRDALLGAVEVERVGAGVASGAVVLIPRAGRAVEGTQIKAVTYHQLEVRQAGSEWRARLYVDV